MSYIIDADTMEVLPRVVGWLINVILLGLWEGDKATFDHSDFDVTITFKGVRRNASK